MSSISQLFDFACQFRYFQNMSFAFTRGRRLAVASCLAFASLQISNPLRAEDPLPQLARLKSSPVLRGLVPNPFDGTPKTDAEKTTSQMYVRPGFKVELIAGEPDVQQPVAFAWDERGRLWVVEAYSYPTKRPEGQGLDKVIILSDEDGDGKFETRKVFAEGLNLASAIEVGYGGVWIGAAPQLLFIPDRNHDDVPDSPPEVMLDGFGYQDTHEVLNSFIWGPDGWLYGIQGVFNTARIGKPGVPVDQRPEVRAAVWRFHPIRHEFEVFANGGSNPWGLDYDEHGDFFMTHCRSYWGKGFATQVMQGGQFWNQVNGNYAPFIIANPPEDFPEFRNYLLAAARYGHGAGGAGIRGSDAIYGGHSHVGTMIYLGDNWPDEYRGHLFTHNLGGHQINHEINQPEGSGYNTVSAGSDMLFCTDPKYVAVDLQYGPDGAVYMTDWVDRQHCHNPNTEIWDRSNGRIYRMEWQANYKPVKVDLDKMSDRQLVEQLQKKNRWYARTALRLLRERKASGLIKEAIVPDFRFLARYGHPELETPTIEFQYARTLLDGGSPAMYLGASSGFSAENRKWAVDQLANEENISNEDAQKLVDSVKTETSAAVRLALASAIQRIPDTFAWPLAEALCQHAEDANDRNLPCLIWDGLAPLMSRGAHASRVSSEESRRGSSARDQSATTLNAGATPVDARETRALSNIDRAFALAQNTKIPRIADWIYWYAATLEGDPLNRVVASLKTLDGVVLHKRLAGLWLAMEPRANLPMPPAWKDVAAQLYADANPKVQRLAEQLAAVFGDNSAFPRLRATLADTAADADARKHAFAVLSRAQDRDSLNTFVALLDDAAFRLPAIQLLSRFDSSSISSTLIKQFNSYSPTEKSAALATLTGRPDYAIALLDAVISKVVPREALTAYDERQLTSLGNAEVNMRVKSIWGEIKQTPADKLARINQLEKVFNEAPLWAYSASAGKEHFTKLCSQCHRIGDVGNRIGPELTGAGQHGIRYFLENIIDPDAVVGADYQMTTIETKSDETISGLEVNETPSAITLRTTAGESVVPKADIKTRAKSEKSLMPEGLLEALNAREQIELLKFLTGS